MKLEKGSRTGAVSHIASYTLPGCRRKALLRFLGEQSSSCGSSDQPCDFCKVGVLPVFEPVTHLHLSYHSFWLLDLGA